MKTQLQNPMLQNLQSEPKPTYYERPIFDFCPVCQDEIVKTGHHQNYCSKGCAAIAAQWWRKVRRGFKPYKELGLKMHENIKAGTFEIIFPKTWKLPEKVKCIPAPRVAIYNQGYFLPSGKLIIRETLENFMGDEVFEMTLLLMKADMDFSEIGKVTLSMGYWKIERCRECEQEFSNIPGSFPCGYSDFRKCANCCEVNPF